MSNIVKESLEENMDEILKNLPEEFHSDLKASVEAAAPSEKLNAEQAKQQAAELMKENPSINDAECIPLLDSDTALNLAIAQPSGAELEVQKKNMLAEIETSLAAE